MSILKKTIILLGDFLILYFSLVLTLIIRYGINELPLRLENHFLPFTVIILLWLVIFYLSDLYHQKTLNRKRISRFLGTTVFFSLLTSVIVFYLFGDFFKLTPKTNLLIFGLVFFALDFLWRILIANFFTSGALGTVILGNSPLVEETINYIKENPQAGYKVILWLENINPDSLEKIERPIKDRLAQLIVATKNQLTEELSNKLVPLLSLEVNFVDFWDFYELIFEKVPIEELKEGWFIQNVAAHRPIYDHVKRFVDLVLAFFLGILLIPISILIAILIKISSSGPVIYKQERAGKGGQPITIYKFRSMTNQNNGPLWTEDKDSRITAIGKFLRFTHFDEIPQLLNIVRGDISFTGPRPERLELRDQFKKLPYYEMRHIVKPGLSGWAQVNYKPSASLEEAYEKLRYDIFYVKNRSFLLDLKIILKTIKYVFSSHK